MIVLCVVAQAWVAVGANAAMLLLLYGFGRTQRWKEAA